jgi:hypothetical protein
VPADPGAPHRRGRRRRGRDHHQAPHQPRKEELPGDRQGPGPAGREIYEAAKVLKQFDPKPGREYTAEEPTYITPDVYVHKVGRQILRRRERRWPAEAQDLRLLPYGAGGGRQGARVHPGKATERAMADQVDPAAPADDRPGDRSRS